MNHLLIFGLIVLIICVAAIVAGFRFGWELLQQNGRMLLRMEALEKRLKEIETAGKNQPAGPPPESQPTEAEPPDLDGKSHAPGQEAENEGEKAEMTQGLVTPAPTSNGDERAERFGNRSLAKSKLKRDGLKAGTVAPDFRLPRLEGGELALSELRGRLVLLVFSSPHCGPCNVLAPRLEKFYRKHPSPRPSLDEPRTGFRVAHFSPRGKSALDTSGGALQDASAQGGDSRRSEAFGSAIAETHGRDARATAAAAAESGRQKAEIDQSFVTPAAKSPGVQGANASGEPSGIEVVMVSKGEAEENRDKVKEHGLTFPVVLQKQWEVSREYAMFATPVGYLIDGAGVITADVAVGVDGVGELMTRAETMLGQRPSAAKPPLLKRMTRWPVAGAAALLQRLMTTVTKAKSKMNILELTHFKFVPRPDDIFIVTYPRSGTTWMQMILYQLTTNGSMGFNHISESCPWFEHSPDSENGFENRATPRIFKSHLPYEQIPKGPGRYIYVARDGRDVAVSYYNLYRSHNGYKGTFEEFFELFMRGKVIFGSWFKHVGGWWKHRHKLNVLFLNYEELVKDLEGCLGRIIAFCHLEVAPEKLPFILERCRFAFMKEHEDKFDPAMETLLLHGVKLNSFLRAGRTGEGARALTPEQQVRYDEAFRVLLEPHNFRQPAPAPPP